MSSSPNQHFLGPVLFSRIRPSGRDRGRERLQDDPYTVELVTTISASGFCVGDPPVCRGIFYTPELTLDVSTVVNPVPLDAV